MEMEEKQRYAVSFDDWHTIGYREAWERQQHVFDSLIEGKLSGAEIEGGRWIFCEHPPVVTLGKHGKKNNLLYSPEWLTERGVEYVETDRGGDITYHGYGQLVCYPVLDLDRLHLGLKAYIYRLEQSVIGLLSRYGIVAGRVAGATGVWLDGGMPAERKICAMGVKSSRFVTMHGLALNVNTDLSGFSYIHPCGFQDKGVTSMARELGTTLDMEQVKRAFEESVRAVFPEIDFGR